MMICSNAHCQFMFKGFQTLLDVLNFRLLALLASATHAFGSPWKQCSSTSADEKSPEIENSKDHWTSKIKHSGLWRLYRNICWKQARYQKYVIIPTPSPTIVFQKSKTLNSKPKNHSWIWCHVEAKAPGNGGSLPKEGCSILAGRMGIVIVYKTHEENKHWTVTFRKTTLSTISVGPQPAQIALHLTTHIHQPKASKSKNSRNYLHFDPGVTGSWQKLPKLRSLRVAKGQPGWTCPVGRRSI